MQQHLASTSQVWRQTAVIVGFSTIISVLLTCSAYYVFYGIDPNFWVALFFACTIPTAASLPVGWYLSSQNFKLNTAYAEIAKSKEQLNELAEKLQYEASHDAMTKMLNRNYFFAKMEDRIISHRENALLLIDADHFKKINDEFGHQQGDVALKEIASVLRKFAKKSDLVGRIGGEEFAILLHGKSEAEAMIIAEKIRNEIENIQFNPRSELLYRLTVSAGLVMVKSANTAHEMRKADQALYVAKDNGRNKVVAHSMLDIADFQQNVRDSMHIQVLKVG